MEGVKVLRFSELKPSTHQVAGHQFEKGHPGSLVDNSGCFYKPLQNGERGDREIKFYEKFWADEGVPSSIKEFFPQHRGVVFVESADGKGLIKHAVLEDLTKGFKSPCIVDIKMGFQTWYPEAKEDYIERCRKKDRESTTSSLGLRISGMQVYNPASQSKWKADRNWCRTLDPPGVVAALRLFVSTNPCQFPNPPDALCEFVCTNPSQKKEPDAALAFPVYGNAITQLEELRSWFESQTQYHFYSSSILVIYEAPEAGGNKFAGRVSVKLVDFAHVTYGHHDIDDSYLRALQSLIGILKQLAGIQA